MNVGVVVPDWGGSPVFGNGKNLTIAQDLNASGVSWVRWDAGNSVANLKTYWLNPFANFRVCLAFSTDTTGDYNTGGIQAVNAVSWASWALGIWQTNGLSSARVPAIEVLNEPWADWWGASPISQANAVAYGALVKQVYTTFHAALGAGCPKILAYTFLNGAGKDQAVGAIPAWWTWLIAAHPDIASFYDGVILHPYGAGTPYGKTLAAAGDRNAIVTAAQTTGKRVWVTEYGWVDGRESPNGLGDAPWAYMFTDAEIAANVSAFNDWCRSSGYVDATFVYEYLDDPTPDLWGICYGNNPAGVSHGGNYVHKPGPFAALAAAATFTAPLSVGVGE